MRGWRALIAIIFLSGTLCACVSPLSDMAAMRANPAAQPSQREQSAETATEREAKAPSGYVAFCERNPGECDIRPNQPSKLTFSQEVWEKLETVNNVVNTAVRPLDDVDHYGVVDFWTVPVDGQGDCEDYVLAKRKMLTLLGLPGAALRITVVFSKNKVRHAILTVVTDRGDYVLDNVQGDILPAEKTGYQWIERQDTTSPTGWIAMN
jgi:predicted transglutaminase-like cysteine proteinase